MNPTLIVFFVGVLASLIHIFLSKQPKTRQRVVELLLLYQLVFSVGINSLLAFYGHAFMSDRIAEYIGWPPGNPFQLEVAFTNFTLGILGILCIWIRGNFWLAVVLAVFIWYMGDALVHIRDIVLFNNHAPGNAGLPLYTDIFLPIILIVLVIIYGMQSKKDQHYLR